MTDFRADALEQNGWVTVSGEGLHLLVRGDARDKRIAEVKEAVAGGDLDEVLDALTRGGMRSAPDFVAVAEGDPARVVVRGSAYAVLSGAGGSSTEVRAGRRGSWADVDAPAGVAHVSLRSGEEPDEETEAAAVESKGDTKADAPDALAEPEREREPKGAAPTTGSGWRLPSRLGGQAARSGGPASAAVGARWAGAAAARPTQTPVPPRPAASESAIAGPPAPDADVEELPSYDHLFGSTQHGIARYLDDHETGTIAEEPIGSAPLREAGGFTSSGAPQNSDMTLPPPSDTRRQAAGTPEQQAPSGPAPAGASPSAPPTPARSAAAARPAEDASGAPAAGPASDDSVISSVPWSGGPGGAPPPPVTPGGTGVRTPAPAPSLRPQAPAATTSVQPAPSQPAPAQQAAPMQAGPIGGSDVDEATIDRKALAAGEAQVAAGPMVLAVLCPAGHPSPPHASTCRVCQREIPAQQPFEMPRPALGVLRMSTGDVVTLDRGVLLGRAPRVQEGIPVASRPHLLRLASAQNDISRNHAEILLEGWHVMVRDLGSTNGTTVALPGQPPLRLRPSDQQVLEPGTVVTLAEEISFTYEAGS